MISWLTGIESSPDCGEQHYRQQQGAGFLFVNLRDFGNSYFRLEFSLSLNGSKPTNKYYAL